MTRSTKISVDFNIAELSSSCNERSADNVLPRSSFSVKWTCPECHGEYTAPISDMVSGKVDCPYCNDRQVLPGFNSLAKRYPNIAELWSSCNERSADNVLPRSKRQEKWICPDCHGEYSALIVDMVSDIFWERRSYRGDFSHIHSYEPIYRDTFKRNIDEVLDSVYRGVIPQRIRNDDGAMAMLVPCGAENTN